MSNTVQLIVTLSKGQYERLENIQYGGIAARMIFNAIRNGIPLDSDSERAEVQAYFAGEAYGWEQGRKALIEDAKAEIEQILQGIDTVSHNEYENAVEQGKEITYENVLSILENIGKAESEDE